MRILFDRTLKRPGCVMLQVACGCGLQAALMFDSEDWLLTPTPDMRVYEVTEDEVVELAKMAAERRQA